MTEDRCYDLMDEVNCADTCEAVTALCELVVELMKDIQHLEVECIGIRYLLAGYMDEEQSELLKADILENLGRRFKGVPAYDLYRNLMYDGGDPMDFREYLVKVQEAAKGNVSCWH